MSFIYLVAGDYYTFFMQIPAIICTYFGATVVKKKFGVQHDIVVSCAGLNHMEEVIYVVIFLFFIVGNVGSEMANQWLPNYSILTYVT